MASSSGRRKFLAAGGAACLTGMGASGAASAKTVTNPVTNRVNPRLEPALTKGAIIGASENVVLPPFEVRVLNKMGFGPARRQLGTGVSVNPDVIMSTGFETPTSDFATQDDVAHFIALGSTDDERLANYVEEQLDPDLDDSEWETRFAQYADVDYETLSDPLRRTFGLRMCEGFSTYDRPRREVEMAAFFRACYSRRQLFELMVDFWHNHFNVYVFDNRDVQAAWASWDTEIIRPNCFGNFYNMVIAQAQHPAMMHYLDNVRNSVSGINENFCRELFELHCMGAENYAGDAFPFQVDPVDVQPDGSRNPYAALNDPDLDNPGLGVFLADPNVDVAKFYTDTDVLEAAQAMTGWRYDENQNADAPNCGTGGFIANEDAHNSDASKSVLTRGFAAIPANLGAEFEGKLICKIAAYHPGTATYIARKLCTRLISDNPPESIVTAAAQTFFAHRKSNDQIARTLRTILLSDEFKDAANWGAKTKRPFEYVVSAMRAGGMQHDLRPDDDASEDFMNRYDDGTQELFTWRTPDGFPDNREHWEGSTSLVKSWRTIDWMFDRDFRETNRFMRAINITLDNLSGNPTPRQVVEFWCNWLYGFTPAGSWCGPVGTLHQSAPTKVGSVALQFMTQLGFAGNADASVWSYDEPILRNDLRANDSPFYWHQRLTGMVKLLVWSPQFMQR
ncbi:MAG: DUF1800 domain-containing protein [Xanthomonadales bacterium]|nr:DUF1800 domain-containing protein [Xanthomonadales bacterium]